MGSLLGSCPGTTTVKGGEVRDKAGVRRQGGLEGKPVEARRGCRCGRVPRFDHRCAEGRRRRVLAATSKVCVDEGRGDAALVLSGAVVTLKGDGLEPRSGGSPRGDDV